MQRMNRKTAIIAGSVFLGILLIFLLSRGCGNGIAKVFDYEKISRGEIKKTISVTGTLEVMNSYVVTSQISGIVTNVYVDFNQQVKRDQVLVSINAIDLKQDLLKVAAELEKSKLELDGAKRVLESKKNLFKDNLISKKDMENSELTYKKIAAQHKQIQIEYNIALKNKGYSQVRAPGPGIIISREIDANTPVKENKVLFVIAEDLKKMKLIISVDETDIGYIKNGQKVYFNVSAFPENTFTGTINQVRFYPIKKGDIVTYQSLVICDNKELLLKPGMTATATVIVSKKENVIRAPNQAFVVSPIEITDEKKEKVVWVKQSFQVSGLPVKKVAVKTGLVGDYYTEILTENLQEGDEVLIGMHNKMETKDELSSYDK